LVGRDGSSVFVGLGCRGERWDMEKRSQLQLLEGGERRGGGRRRGGELELNNGSTLPLRGSRDDLKASRCLLRAG